MNVITRISILLSYEAAGVNPDAQKLAHYASAIRDLFVARNHHRDESTAYVPAKDYLGEARKLAESREA